MRRMSPSVMRPTTPLFALLSATALVCLLFFSSSARAEGAKASVDELIQEGLKKSALSLKNSQPTKAIVLLESLADQGVTHPELSFNRALSYLARSRTERAQVGDLGQSAAGFAEALELRSDDPEAQRGLAEVQILVASKDTKRKKPSENQSLGLMEQLLESLNPWFLFLVGATGSLAACIGLLFRYSQIETRRLGGTISLGLGALILVIAGGLFAARSSLFDGSRLAVVTSQRAALLDEAGAQEKGSSPLREGTLVHVGRARRGVAPLIGFGQSTWIRLGQVRVLATGTKSQGAL